MFRYLSFTCTLLSLLLSVLLALLQRMGEACNKQQAHKVNMTSKAFGGYNSIHSLQIFKLSNAYLRMAYSKQSSIHQRKIRFAQNGMYGVVSISINPEQMLNIFYFVLIFCFYRLFQLTLIQQISASIINGEKFNF